MFIRSFFEFLFAELILCFTNDLERLESFDGWFMMVERMEVLLMEASFPALEQLPELLLEMGLVFGTGRDNVSLTF